MRRGRSLSLKLLLGLLTAAASIAPAVADVHPNTAPGFPVEQSFHVGDIDSVNLFNNGLTLTIPIGGSYPVNGGFSYGLKLVYNSNPWLFKTVKYPNPLDPMNDLSRTQAYPTPCSNAGLGWRVSLGRMNPPCQVPDANDTFPLGPVYQDENGTDHVFYPTLHPGDAEDAPVSGVSDIQYTRDGSYLGDLPQQLGITLPAGSMSIVPGVTQIFASPNIGAKMTAMVVAHELAHAWLFLGVRPCSHEVLSGNRQDLRGYVNVFTKSAADEASRNYDPFYPYNQRDLL
jgi:hypothetical protein